VTQLRASASHALSQLSYGPICEMRRYRDVL
jgi:hypothetical protein